MNKNIQEFEMFSKNYNSGKMIQKVLDSSKTDLLNIIKDSNLTGKGLLQNSTYKKWTHYLSNGHSKTYLVCNANESEPGSFKDQKILEEYAEQLIEGIVITCLTLNIDNCIIMLRREYKWLLENIEKAISEYKARKLIGKNILDSSIDIDINILFNYGSYVCGEQNAIVSSINGHRAEPKCIDSPHKETDHLIHNVETLATIPFILENGAEKYKSLNKKLYSISGDCVNPGVYELNNKSKLIDVLDLVCALPVKAVHLGGIHGHLIDQITDNIKLEYSSEFGSSVIIYGKARNLLHVIQNIIKFYHNESCGQCTPCREGFFRLAEFFDIYKNDNQAITRSYINTISNIIETIELSSRCPFGRKGVTSIKYYFKKYISGAL